MNFHTTRKEAEEGDDDSSDDGHPIGLAEGLSAETLAALLQFVEKTNNEDEKDVEDNNTERSICNIRKLPSTSTTNQNRDDADQDVHVMAQKIEESLGVKPDPDRNCTSLLATAPCDAVEILLRDGLVRLDNILSEALCDRCVKEIDERLLAARSTGMDYYTDGVKTFFGNVDANSNRWDMFLSDTGAFHDSMRYMLQTKPKATSASTSTSVTNAEKESVISVKASTKSPSTSTSTAAAAAACSCGGDDGGDTETEVSTTLASVFESIFNGEDSSFYEYAALISDGGATSQRIHSDTTYQAICPVYTVFIALQDVTPELGPTVFIPGSHTEGVHKSFRFRKHSMLCEAQYKHALLKKGDIVIMDSRTFHCGSANTSEANPDAITVTVNSASCSSGSGSGSGSGGTASAATAASATAKYRGRRSLLYFSLLSPSTPDMGHGSMLQELRPTLHQMMMMSGSSGDGCGGGVDC